MDLGENFQAVEGAIAAAEHLHTLHQALLAQGFEEDTATLITIAYMTKQMEMYTPKWWEFWK